MSDFRSQIHWRMPWRVLAEDEAAKLAAELRREISNGHVHSGLSATAVGRRADNDDALFYLGDAPPRFAVVHLTYRKETDPKWPHTVVYDSLDDWIAKCMMPDAE